MTDEAPRIRAFKLVSGEYCIAEVLGVAEGPVHHANYILHEPAIYSLQRVTLPRHEMKKLGKGQTPVRVVLMPLDGPGADLHNVQRELPEKCIMFEIKQIPREVERDYCEKTRRKYIQPATPGDLKLLGGGK